MIILGILPIVSIIVAVKLSFEKFNNLYVINGINIVLIASNNIKNKFFALF